MNGFTPRPYRPIATLAIAALGLLGTTAITGCSSPDRSWDTNTTRTASDPAQAYNQRSRGEAITLFNQASQYHENGDFDNALIKYRESIQKDNTIFAAWNNMGQLLMREKNYADAVSAYKIASDLQLNDPRPDYNIGLAYQIIGWGKESFTHFDRSLDRDPNYLPSLRGIVRSAEMLGTGDQRILDFIRSGQLRETEDQWREYFDRQRFRVEKLIEEST